MLIGLYSKGRRAGKDTGAQFIREWCRTQGLSYERLAFADLPKLLVGEILGLRGQTREETVALVDDFKLHGRVLWAKDARVPPGNAINGRDFIINLCGELGEEQNTGARLLFGESFWTDAVIPPDFHSYRDVTVVTDVRADEEARRIRDVGGVIWEIVNSRVEAPGGRSEKGISLALIDAHIYNEGTLEEYRDAIQALIGIQSCV